MAFLALCKQKVNIFYVPVSGFFVGYSIYTKIASQWKQQWQGMALRPTQAVWKSNTSQYTRGQPHSWNGRSVAVPRQMHLPGPKPASGHWLEGAEPHQHNTSVLLKICSSHTHLCMQAPRNLDIILAANQEVMGCAFLGKHSLSVCCLSVCGFTVSSRSLCTSGLHLSL